MIERVVVADRNENISRTRPDALGSQFAFEGEVELVHLDVRGAATVTAPLRNSEYDVQQYRKCAASHGGHRLGEEVDEGDQEQRQGNQAEAHGNLHATNIKIERNLKFTLAGARVTKNENSKPVHRKAPDDSKGVEVGEESDVTATYDDGKNLHENDDVDDAVARPVAFMRLAKPVAEDAVFRNAVQHAVGANDRGVHRAGKNQSANHHHEGMESKANKERAFQAHGQAAD